MVRLGAHLGLVKTEPESPDSRAYLRAHQALHWLRNYLVGCQLERVQPDRVIFRRDGQTQQIQLQGSLLQASLQLQASGSVRPLVHEPEQLQEVDLGPSGWARFEYRDGALEVTLEAGDDSLGQPPGRYQTRIRFVLGLRGGDPAG